MSETAEEATITPDRESAEARESSGRARTYGRTM